MLFGPSEIRHQRAPDGRDRLSGQRRDVGALARCAGTPGRAWRGTRVTLPGAKWMLPPIPASTTPALSTHMPSPPGAHPTVMPIRSSGSCYQSSMIFLWALHFLAVITRISRTHSQILVGKISVSFAARTSHCKSGHIYTTRRHASPQPASAGGSSTCSHSPPRSFNRPYACHHTR